MTNRSYSNSTSKHIGYARNAVSHKTIVTCYDPTKKEGNFKYFLDDIEAVLPLLAKARKPEKYLSKIAQIVKSVDIFAKTLKLKTPKEFNRFRNLGEGVDIIEYEKQKLAKIKRDNARKLKEDLAKFMSGERDYAPTPDGEYCRLDGDFIRTTKGIKMSIDNARLLYIALKRGSLKRGDKVEYYTVLHHDAKTTKIGCHTFKTKYLIEFGDSVFA